MTMTLEVGEIKRFASPGDFASYCRVVEAKRTSNQKKKGENNSKCGNKYFGLGVCGSGQLCAALR